MLTWFFTPHATYNLPPSSSRAATTPGDVLLVHLFFSLCGPNCSLLCLSSIPPLDNDMLDPVLLSGEKTGFVLTGVLVEFRNEGGGKCPNFIADDTSSNVRRVLLFGEVVDSTDLFLSAFVFCVFFPWEQKRKIVFLLFFFLGTIVTVGTQDWVPNSRLEHGGNIC